MIFVHGVNIMSEAKYYNWGKTRSFYNRKMRQAEFTAVIGGKGIGKTFGIRKQVIEDYISKGERFCELCRYANQMESIMGEYTEKLQFKGFFKDYIFKCEKDILYIAKKPEPYWIETKNGDSKEVTEKPEWEICGYFAAMTQYVTLKQRTFVNVCTIIVDEFILERESQYTRYLSNEYTIFMRCCSSIWREEKDDQRRLRCVMIANAVDFLNPYFAAWNITEPPKSGYSWWLNKSLLIDMVDMSTVDIGSDDTLVSRMTTDDRDRAMAYDNRFKNYDTEFIAPKSKVAQFFCELRYRDKNYGIWKDSRYYYVNDEIPPKGIHKILNFHIEDATLTSTVFILTSTFPTLMRYAYFGHRLRYSNAAIKDEFFKFLKEMGIR